jgi:hypothetical protein
LHGKQVAVELIVRLDIRQPAAAVGRRVNTLCQGEGGFVMPKSRRRELSEVLKTCFKSS